MHCRWAFLAPLLVSRVGGVYDPERRIESARLYGNIAHYAYYFVDLLIGDPPQRASVILDTGSSFCAFPCSGCRHCGSHIDPLFDVSKSKTAKWVNCGSTCRGSCTKGHCSYHQAYLEGSAISGFWFEDLLRLGDAIQRNPPVVARLGCHQEENRLFYTQKANGIFGVQGPKTPLQTLFADHSHVDSTIFSICIAHEGGRLTVGGHNNSYHVAPVQYIPLADFTKYKVVLTSMRVGDKGIVNFRDTLIDSGTTYTYMAAQHYHALKEGIENYCKHHNECGAKFYSNCYHAKDGLEKFPVIDMMFGSVLVKWHAREYLYRQSATSTRWCYAFQNDGNTATTTLGMSWMLYKEIIFDLKNLSVGIAPANCPEYRERPVHRFDPASLETPTVAPGRWRAPRTHPVSNSMPAEPPAPGYSADAKFPDSFPDLSAVRLRWNSPSKEVLLALSVVTVLVASVFTIRFRYWLGIRPEAKTHVRVAQEDPDSAPSGKGCTPRPAACIVGSVVEF